MKEYDDIKSYVVDTINQIGIHLSVDDSRPIGQLGLDSTEIADLATSIQMTYFVNIKDVELKKCSIEEIAHKIINNNN
jgi:acyl carrier protein